MSFVSPSFLTAVFYLKQIYLLSIDERFMPSKSGTVGCTQLSERAPGRATSSGNAANCRLHK